MDEKVSKNHLLTDFLKNIIYQLSITFLVLK